MVYLDYAANSPVDENVLDYYYDITKKYYANPNSSHGLGLEAKKMIDEATIILPLFLEFYQKKSFILVEQQNLIIWLLRVFVNVIRIMESILL